MTPRQLHARIVAGTAPQVLDVRSRAEYEEGHVPGARHCPFWKVLRSPAAAPVAADAPLVVYCGHGPRAWLAGAALRRRGFHDVTYLDGHMQRWRDERLPEER